MTRRPPPRHRLRHRTRRHRAIDTLLVTAAVLGLASVMAAGNAMAPRPRVETVPDLPVAAGHTDTRVSRYEREALLTVTETSAAVELATIAPTRACRCSPREPLVTAALPTETAIPAASVVPQSTSSTTTATEMTAVTSLTEVSAPSDSTSSAPTSTNTVTTSTPTTEPTSTTALPTETTAAETTPEVTEEAP